MPDARLGTLFLAYFAGQFCGSWLATPKLRRSLVLGAIGAAFGMSLLAFASAATAHIALFCAGLGLGAGLTAGNVVVGTLETGISKRGSNSLGTSRSRDLALLNVAWGFGAIACPLLLEMSLRVHRFQMQRGQFFFLALAAALGLCAAMLALILTQRAGEIAHATQAINEPQIPWRVFLLFGATFMLYVGVENSLGGWLPTYAQRISSGGTTVGRASAIAMCFWICELASRGLTAALIKFFRELFFYRACLAAFLATAAVLVLTPHLGTAAIFAITAVAAFSVAPLYPLAVSFLLSRTGNHPRVGKVFACASLGGTILPWLTGVLSTQFQSLRIGFTTPVAGAVLMLLLSFYLPRHDHENVMASQ